VLLYDTSTGEAHLFISQPGQPFAQHTYSGWSQGSRLLTTAEYGRSKKSVLIHDPSTSELEIWDFNDGRRLLGRSKLFDSWDRALSGRFGGVTTVSR
jgi:hypothetical protein